MEYYAATLREPGEKLNNDGLMIKGIRTKKRSDIVVMVLSAHKAGAKLNDKVIRTAERIVYTSADDNIEDHLEKLFYKFGKNGFLFNKKIPDITVLVLQGINYYIMNRGKNRIMRIGRADVEEITGMNSANNRAGFSYTAGRLSEGSTLIAGTSSFYDRQLGTDIHKRLCPQMCVDNDAMQENIEYLSNLLFSRGEERPVTAAALCLK